MKSTNEILNVSLIRRRAEKKLAEKQGKGDDIFSMSSDLAQQYVHELQVHQIELDIQNHELRLIQDKLEKARDKYSNLYNFSPVAYLTLNEQGLIEEANLTGLSMFGVKRDEFVGIPFTRFIHKEDQDTFYLHRLGIQEKEKSSSCELRLTHSTGEIFNAHIVCMASKDSDRQTKHIRMVVSDITKQKKMEESLDLFRELVNQSNDLIYVIDVETGRLLDLNEKACKDLKYTREELLTLEIVNIESTLSERISWENHSRMIKKSGSLIKEGLHRRKDGTSFPVEANYQYIQLKGKEYVVTVARNISHRKEMEARLIHSQKMEALGSLAGGIAHDFNNILSVIMGNTELAMGDTDRNAPQHENLEEVLIAAKRAKALIQQILIFSRKSIPEKKPVQVKTILQDAIKTIRATVPTTIEVQLNIQAEETAIMGNAEQIYQAIINLCTNSLHALEDNGGIIRIGLENVRTVDEQDLGFDCVEDHLVKLSISDTGVGISPEIVARIFEPYVTTKKFGKGTGLGLAVVQGIVELHNGLIKVRSTPGKGSCFDLYFPLMVEKPMKCGEDLGEDSLMNNKHILYVDDESQLVSMHKKMLEHCGFRVTEKVDSMQALDVFMEDPNSFDAVITDMCMPRMTGVQLAVEIKKIRSDIPIILCTGYSESITAEKAKEMGVDSFLIKPVLNSELLKTLKQHIACEKRKLSL